MACETQEVRGFGMGEGYGRETKEEEKTFRGNIISGIWVFLEFGLAEI
jgi:hypothetical protein